MSNFRELVEDEVFTNQLATLGYSEEDLDAALDAAAWALTTNAEHYEVIKRTQRLRITKTDPYNKGKVWIPQLKIWFTIENDDQVLLKAITIAPDEDPIF